MNLDDFNCLDIDSTVSAISSWMTSKATKLTKVRQAINSIIQDVSNDDEHVVITSVQLQSKFSSVGMQKGTVIGGSEGFLTVEELCDQLAPQISSYMSDDSIELSDLSIIEHLGSSNTITESFPDFVDNLIIASNNAIASGCAVKAANMVGNSTDKLNEFITECGVFDLDTNNLSTNILAYYRSIISGCSNGLQAFKNIFSSVDTNAVQSGISLKNTDISQYTGCSPLSAFSIDGVYSGVGTIVGVACAGLNAIFNFIETGIEWAWNKFGKPIVQAVTNPYDCTDAGDGDYSFAQFQYQYQYRVPQRRVICVIPGNATTASLMRRKFTDNYLDKWVTFNTYGAINIGMFDDIDIEFNSVSNVVEIAFPRDTNVVMIMKPRSLNYKPARTCSIQQMANEIQSMTGSVYVTPDDVSENKLMEAFCNGFAFNAIALNDMQRIANGSSHVNSYNWALSVPATVTNRDWLQVATGYNTNNTDDPYCPYVYIPALGTDGAHLSLIFSDFIVGMIQILSAHAADETIFLPFNVGASSLPTGRFGIKTDQQNTNLANAIVSAFIIVATVVAVVLTGAIIARKIAKSLAWKRTEFIGRMDNKMWNGDKLTLSEKWKYQRYCKKANIADLMSRGTAMTSVVNPIAGVIDNTSSIEDRQSIIYNKITGREF